MKIIICFSFSQQQNRPVLQKPEIKRLHLCQHDVSTNNFFNFGNLGKKLQICKYVCFWFISATSYRKGIFAAPFSAQCRLLKLIAKNKIKRHEKIFDCLFRYLIIIVSRTGTFTSVPPLATHLEKALCRKKKQKTHSSSNARIFNLFCLQLFYQVKLGGC